MGAEFDDYKLSRAIRSLQPGDTIVYEQGIFHRTEYTTKVERRTPTRAYFEGGGWVRVRDGKILPTHRFGYAEIKEVHSER